MVAQVQPPDDDELDDESGDRRRGRACGDGDDERRAFRRGRSGDVRAEHVDGAVREIDHAHDPEHQREPRREQKDHHAELQPVEDLLECEAHWLTLRPEPVEGSG